MKFKEIDFTPLHTFATVLKEVFGDLFTVHIQGYAEYSEVIVRYRDEKNVIALVFDYPLCSSVVSEKPYMLDTRFRSSFIEESIQFFVEPKLLDEEKFVICLKGLLSAVPMVPANQTMMDHNEIERETSKWFDQQIEDSTFSTFITLKQKIVPDKHSD